YHRSQIADDVALHPEMRSPGLFGCVDIETCTLPQIIGFVIGNAAAARARIRRDDGKSEFRRIAIGTRFRRKVFLRAGKSRKKSHGGKRPFAFGDEDREGHGRARGGRLMPTDAERTSKAAMRRKCLNSHQYTTTERIDLPSCMRSKPLLMSSSGMVWVMRSSILIFPSMYQSTIFGTSVRPRAPPKAVPFQTRPVTSWNGRVEISCPAPATPTMMLSPQPRWQLSSAWRMTFVLPVQSNV